MKTIIIAIALVLTAGCSVSTAPSAGEAFGACGFAETTTCGESLECFDVCTFECGAKYSADGSYGIDQSSVDRCASLGGTCEPYAPGVAINVCKLAVQ